MNLVGRCCEEAWGTARDPAAAADWYRQSAQAGYFRGQYNWASVLLKNGREDEAAAWFERAITDSPAALRPAMRAAVRIALARAGSSGALRALASRLTSAAE
jgi:TPR repeat protein